MERGHVKMNQRDRAFLEDMKNFTCMNRLSTVLALYLTGSEPEVITRGTMKGLYFPQGRSRNIPDQESILDSLVQRNAGNIQGIMTARIYAELFAAYEDLGTFGSAIKNRARKGIFARYVANETREAASFLQGVLDKNIPEHPETTLDILLQLPSVAQFYRHLPPEVLDQLKSYYQETPKFLYEIAKHYRLQREDALAVSVGNISPDTWQANITQGTLAIILGFVPETENMRAGRLSVDVFNRIKHQFLVSANLDTYTDPEDTRPLEYAFLPREQAFLDGIINGVASIAKIMSDFALILLLLDDRGIAL